MPCQCCSTSRHKRRRLCVGGRAGGTSLCRRCAWPLCVRVLRMRAELVAFVRFFFTSFSCACRRVPNRRSRSRVVVETAAVTGCSRMPLAASRCKQTATCGASGAVVASALFATLTVINAQPAHTVVCTSQTSRRHAASISLAGVTHRLHSALPAAAVSGCGVRRHLTPTTERAAAQLHVRLHSLTPQTQTRQVVCAIPQVHRYWAGATTGMGGGDERRRR